MKKFRLLPIVTILILMNSYSGLFAQGGSDCSSATVANTGSNTADNALGDQWFKYTATIDGVITISSCGLAFEDTWVSVYDTCNGNLIVQNDDVCGQQSEVSFQCYADSTYYINWDDRFTSGFYSWELTEATVTQGEECFMPFEITNTIDTLQADHTGGVDQWYHFVAPFSGKARVRSCGFTTEDTYVTAHYECGGYPFVGSDHGCSFQSDASFDVEEGDDYYISWSGNSTSGIYDWEFSLRRYYPGETCDTTVIDAVVGNNMVNHRQERIKQIYKYQLTQDAKVTVSTCGLTDGDTEVSVYKNNCFGSFVGNNENYCQRQSQLTFWGDSGDIFYFHWFAPPSTPMYAWNLSVDLQHIPPGINCENPIDAVVGTNNADHSDANTKWYRFIPDQDGTVTIQNCGYTTDDTYVEVNEGCEGPWIADNYDYCDDQSRVQFWTTADDTLIIQWRDDQRGAYNWDLTFEPGPKPQGTDCENSMTASTGINNADNSKGEQWYEYTATSPGIINLTTCDLTNEDTYVRVYNDCNGSWLASNDDDCGVQTSVDFQCYEDSTYYILWDDVYTDADFEWKLTEKTAKTNFLTYAFPQSTGNTTIDSTNHTIDVEVAMGTNLSSLTASFTLSNGATAYVGGTLQFSGSSSNDFSSPVTYTVESDYGAPDQDWTVTVTEAASLSNQNDILTFSIPEQTGDAVIDVSAHTVDIEVNWESFTDLSSLQANFTYSPLASASDTTGTTINSGDYFDFSSPYVFRIEAEDGSVQDWVATITQQPAPTGVECGDPLTAINGTNQCDFTVSDPQWYTYTPADTGLIEVINHGEGGKRFYFYDTCSVPHFEYEYMNYLDTLIFECYEGQTIYILIEQSYGDEVFDWELNELPLSDDTRIYDFGFAEETSDAVIDTTNHTIAAEVASTADITNLAAYFSINDYAEAYVNNALQSSFFTTNDFTNPVEYKIEAQNGDTLIWTVTVTQEEESSEAEILAYAIPEEASPAFLNAPTNTITVEVPNGTDVSNLVADFALSPNANASIGGIAQTSGVTANDFSSNVTYNVFAEDSTQKDWTVRIIEISDTATDIFAFSFNEQTGPATIDYDNHTVDIEVNGKANLSSLIASYALSSGASAKIGTVDQTSGITANDFSAPVTYTITAANGSDTQDWTVNVSQAALSSENDILAFSLPDMIGTANIDNGTHLITISVPRSANLTDMIATFTLSDYAIAKIDGITQVSGSTHNDFSSTVVYEVIAQDETSQDWAVKVSKPQSARASFASENTLKIYPNPGKDVVTIELETRKKEENVKIEIFNLQGQQIKIINIPQVEKATRKLNLTDFNDGIYIIRASNGKFILTEKLVVNK